MSDETDTRISPTLHPGIADEIADYDDDTRPVLGQTETAVSEAFKALQPAPPPAPVERDGGKPWQFKPGQSGNGTPLKPRRWRSTFGLPRSSGNWPSG